MIVPIKDILEDVCSYYAINPYDIFDKTRKREVVQKRQVFFYIAAIHSKSSLWAIGNMATDYGRKTPIDHATVRHSKIQVENLMFTDKELKEEVTDILCTIRKRDSVRYTNVEIIFKTELDKILNLVQKLDSKLN